MPSTTLCRSVEIGIRMIGMWPTSLFPVLYRLTWFLAVVILQIFQYWFIVYNIASRDLSLLVDSATVAFVYTLMGVKLIFVWINKQVFHDTLALMTTDWRECTNDFHIHAMCKKANLSQRFSNSLIGINATAVILHEIGSLALLHTDKNSIRDLEFSFKMKFPFNVSGSPIYEIIFILTIIHHVVSTVIVAVLNSSLVSLVFHVSGQIDIVCHGLCEMTADNSTRDSVTETIKNLVMRHQKIIVFSSNIESLFTHIALVQILWNTIVICCLGFMIVISIGNDDTTTMLAKSFLFYLSISLEAFMFCFAGEYLSTKSKSIGDAAYSVQWYDLSSSDCKLLLFLITRSQKRLTITAGKMMDLSMEGFANIMKASASYMSVLLAMY